MLNLRQRCKTVQVMESNCSFEVCLPTTFKPLSLSLSGPRLGKLRSPPRCNLLWHQQEVQTMQGSSPRAGTLTQPPLLTTLKTPSQSPFSALSSHFWTSFEVCPAFPRIPHNVSNKPFHILLAHVWHHQFWQCTKFWVGVITTIQWAPMKKFFYMYTY